MLYPSGRLDDTSGDMSCLENRKASSFTVPLVLRRVASVGVCISAIVDQTLVGRA